MSGNLFIFYDLTVAPLVMSESRKASKAELIRPREESPRGAVQTLTWADIRIQYSMGSQWEDHESMVAELH